MSMKVRRQWTIPGAADDSIAHPETYVRTAAYRYVGVDVTVLVASPRPGALAIYADGVSEDAARRLGEIAATIGGDVVVTWIGDPEEDIGTAKIGAFA